MRIFELQATTGCTGLNVSVRGKFVDHRGDSILSQKAFDVYRQKIETEPRLAEYKLRLVIFEYETDKDGIFRLIHTIYRDYHFENNDVHSDIVFIEEKHFNK